MKPDSGGWWKRRWAVLAHDVLWIPVSLLLAYWFRFNLGSIPSIQLSGLYWLMIVALPVQVVFFHLFGLYRGIWRFASVPDLTRIIKSVAAGVALTFGLVFIFQRLEGVPRSVLLLYPMFLVASLAAPRLLYRWWKDRSLHLTGDRSRALIIGAGRAGELLLRDLLKGNAYLPVGLLDDDPDKRGMEIHGVRVLGGLDDIPAQIRTMAVDVVLLAIPSASHQLVRRVTGDCQQVDIPCRTLPSLTELADGSVEVASLREVAIEDLLGRDPVIMDAERLTSLLRDRCVLVTGAGGSIGSELCRQIGRMAPARLVMLDHAEFNLYNIEQEMRSRMGDICIPLLGDVRDSVRMRWVFEHFQPEVIFHAAAYKHVPLVEENPAEGAKTNVFGTCNVADLAVEFGTKAFVLVSTDKAVNPANVMGASKRAAEVYCQNLDALSPKTAFITTRFGNVLGSTGSVVPKFRAQIADGGPVTVTHPEMTRFFMTIPEAVSLILQAGALGQGGEIFVLDMGEPVKIVDLAEQMIRLSGLVPNEDIAIKFTGLRPGEKLYEELFHEAEHLSGTTHPKLMLAESREADWPVLTNKLEQLRDACARRDTDLVRHTLKAIVPEFQGASPAMANAKPDADAVIH
ncbi:MAG: nucleoside-diphosphate sugar epimerase/dehydratase [Zetaproteobacteria bacterium]|nr:MAG: nucleoside-diphosphate sugar epimerase/dehydratase [Zetaproteobacteria bacterium]